MLQLYKLGLMDWKKVMDYWVSKHFLWKNVGNKYFFLVHMAQDTYVCANVQLTIKTFYFENCNNIFKASLFATSPAYFYYSI